MLLVSTASAPESVGGSLAALALYEIIRGQIPRTLGATADPLGIFFRTFAHRDFSAAAIDPQPLDGIPVLNELEIVPEHGLHASADALVFDATGDLARDVRAWPDQLRHLVRPTVDGVIILIANDSQGSRLWLEYVAATEPDTFARALVLCYPIGRPPSTMTVAGRTVPSAPVLYSAGRAQLEATGLPPTAAMRWSGPGRQPTAQNAIRTWLDEWATLIKPYLDPVAATTPTTTRPRSLATPTEYS